MANKNRVILFGVGTMGRKHLKSLRQLSQVSSDVELVAACDTDPEALKRAKELYPDLETVLIKNPDDIRKAVEQYDANTITNATSTTSHREVLKRAVAARRPDGKRQVELIYQEKPFTDSHKKALKIAALLDTNGIKLSYNSILGYSAAWTFLDRRITVMDGELAGVRCSYGKDRTKDTRPATGGYAGIDGTHAADIATHFVRSTKTITGSTVGKAGYLAEKAPHATYAIDTRLSGKNRQGNDVVIDIEGSLAWGEQVRRVQFLFKQKNNQWFVAELSFDCLDKQKNRRFDQLTLQKINGESGRIISTETHEFQDQTRDIDGAAIDVDKLYRYYTQTFDQETRYDLPTALNLNGAVDAMSKPDKVISMDASESPKEPKYTALDKIRSDRERLKIIEPYKDQVAISRRLTASLNY